MGDKTKPLTRKDLEELAAELRRQERIDNGSMLRCFVYLLIACAIAAFVDGRVGIQISGNMMNKPKVFAIKIIIQKPCARIEFWGKFT